MEAVNYLTNWIGWLLLIIPVGAAAMVSYQAFRKSVSDDDSVISDCQTKISNTIKGAIVAETISGIITIVRTYYQ